MRQITQEEFDALPLTGGKKQCPGETDYSLIKRFGEGCSFSERCSFSKGCKVFGRVLCRLYQMSLPNLYTIKLWQMAEGEPIFEVGCFHGNLAEAKARIAGKERREGHAAKYTAAIDALNTIAKLYN